MAYGEFALTAHEAASGSPTPPVVLTVAGTDSGGAAGLAADLKTFAVHGVHGIFVTTLVTAQNSTGIEAVTVLSPDFVTAQFEVLAADYTVAAAKTGLLLESETVRTVAGLTREVEALVVDPVLVRSSGEPFVSEEVVALYRSELVPSARVLTPNTHEAALLTGRRVESIDEATGAGQELLTMGAGSVVVTGVLDETSAADVLVTASGVTVLRDQRVETKNLLGTGCSFAASIAASLGKGLDVVAAVETAHAYVRAGLASGQAWTLGAGHGPIDHIARWRGGELP